MKWAECAKYECHKEATVWDEDGQSYCEPCFLRHKGVIKEDGEEVGYADKIAELVTELGPMHLMSGMAMNEAHRAIYLCLLEFKTLKDSMDGKGC